MTENAPFAAATDSARYAIYGEIASGGMATVQYGRLLGGHGFARAVAIKRLHPQYARDRDVVAMFIDEARLSARLAHANIVPTLDVIEGPSELAIVMEYVHGESLATLLDTACQRGQTVALDLAVALIAGALHGLHAAHEACDENAAPLGIVHRDVSPQNILVGADGVPRVADFGIAKAAGRLRSTPHGEIKGKLVYMAPEQLTGVTATRQVDVYGAAAVLWEVLTGRPLFDAATESAVVRRVLYDPVPPPSSLRPEVPAALDQIVLRGLSRDLVERYATARELADALECEIAPAAQSRVAQWVQSLAGERLEARMATLRALPDRATQVAVGMGFGIDNPPASEPAHSSDPAVAPNTPDPRVSVAAPRSVTRVTLIAGAACVLLGGWVFAQRANRPAQQTDIAPVVRPAERVVLPLAAAPADTLGPEPMPAVDTAPAQALPVEAVARPEAPPRALPLTAARPSVARSASAPHAVAKPAVTGKAQAPRAAKAQAASPASISNNASQAPLTPSAAGRATDKPAAGEREAEVRDCQPPYIVDRQGIRRLKPQCL